MKNINVQLSERKGRKKTEVALHRHHLAPIVLIQPQARIHLIHHLQIQLHRPITRKRKNQRNASNQAIKKSPVRKVNILESIKNKI